MILFVSRPRPMTARATTSSGRHRRGREAVHRHLRHDDPGARDTSRPRRIARARLATGVLLGHRRALLFLDNSPTYVVFLTTAGALGTDAAGAVVTVAGAVDPTILLAISAGAVFMGAVTYIGNAPNFMVKNIAEGAGVKMPSFFGYIGWALAFPHTGLRRRQPTVC